MNEFKNRLKHALETPEISDASKKQLQTVLDDLGRTDSSFSSKLPEKTFQDLHTYFFKHQFTTLKEDMPEKVKNWVLFQQNTYQKKEDEGDEKK